MDFTLNDFKFPGIEGLNHGASYHGFGTDTNNTPLSFNEMADDVAMTFDKQRAVEVTEDVTIARIEHDVKLVVSGGVTITLPITNVMRGTYITFSPNFSSTENAKVILSDSSKSWFINSDTNLILFFNGTAWRENNFSLNDKVNIMLNSCYTGRDLRKVLFDLGDIEADDWTEITCLQVMEALHNRCTNNDFSGLGLGDWVDHDTITVPSCSVTDQNGSTYTWGLNNGIVKNDGGDLTITKNSSYNSTRIRIANFGSIHSGTKRILFEYENCPFKGILGVNTSTNLFNKSSMYQWLNTSYYPALNSALGGYIVSISRFFYGQNVSSNIASDCKVFFPDASEVAGYPVINGNAESNYQYSRWAVYANKPSLVKKKYNNAFISWWMSSGGTNYFAVVDSYGNFRWGTATNGHGCSPAFYIG